MAKIVVNNEKVVNGKMSITRHLDITTNILTIVGQFATHRYFEEIKSLQSERYYIGDITVYQESFGSEDFNIVYSFVAGSFYINGGETIYDEEYIRQKEKEIYGGEED